MWLIVFNDREWDDMSDIWIFIFGFGFRVGNGKVMVGRDLGGVFGLMNVMFFFFVF